MSLKCSLFGCKYGDAEVHREREENGSEVVITIRETQTCSRCGDVRVVSENKEVTTMETAADIVADDLQGESPEETPTDTGPESQPPDATTTTRGTEPSPDDGGTAIPDAEADEVLRAGGDEGTTGDPSAPEAAEDDAVILDEESGEDREPGEWPEEPDDGEEWPEEPNDSDDAAGPSADDGGEVLTDDAAEWPEEPDGSDDAGGPSTDDDHEQPTDDTWEQSTDEEETIEGATQFGSPGDGVSVPEGEFYCPECEYTASVESSSLREGDYCPECHRGSLEQRRE